MKHFKYSGLTDTKVSVSSLVYGKDQKVSKKKKKKDSSKNEPKYKKYFSNIIEIQKKNVEAHFSLQQLDQGSLRVS